MDTQLNQYREEQRRKFEAANVDSQGSFTADQATQPAPSAPPLPSAPPEPVSLQKNEEAEKKKSEAEKEKREAEKRKRESAEKKRQQQLDEEFARRLQDQEGNEHTPQAAEEHVSYPQVQESDTSDDEQLARLLQEEEAQGSTQAPPTVQEPPEQQQPQEEQSTGFFASIGRGLRQAYDIYQQYSQQAAEQQQIAQDEALARQLQNQEGGMQRPMFRVQSPNAGRRANYPNFYNYDEDVDDDEDLFEHRHPSEYENPLGRLREVNSVFRSMGTPVDHPLIQHLHELMNQSQLHGSGPGPRIIFTTQGMPTHRYRYPRPVFQHVRGVETLPPELYQMVQGETDTSYESLLQLAERLQPVSRGASTSQIEELPTRIFTEGSMPASEASCGVCLSDYEQGEELRTLPGCLHSFHKECIDKWLQINKVCPICRHEITNNAEPEPQQQQQQQQQQSTSTTQRHSQR